jgi:hypothetical protein
MRRVLPLVKSAEKAKMDVTNISVVPPVKEMLAIGLQTVQHNTIDQPGVSGEATLR